jgi:hypothetical protein
MNAIFVVFFSFFSFFSFLLKIILLCSTETASGLKSHLKQAKGECNIVFGELIIVNISKFKNWNEPWLV